MSVLHIALLLLINVWEPEDFIWVLHSRPNIHIAIDAAGGEVFVAEVWSQTQRHNLNNLIIVCLHHDVILIPLLQAHNEEVAIAERGDEQVSLLAGNTHVLQWLMRFIGITATLEFVVPHLHRLVISACHEFSLADLCQVGDVAFVGALILKRLLHNDHIVTDGHLLHLTGAILR